MKCSFMTDNIQSILLFFFLSKHSQILFSSDSYAKLSSQILKGSHLSWTVNFLSWQLIKVSASLSSVIFPKLKKHLMREEVTEPLHKAQEWQKINFCRTQLPACWFGEVTAALYFIKTIEELRRRSIRASNAHTQNEILIIYHVTNVTHLSLWNRRLTKMGSYSSQDYRPDFCLATFTSHCKSCLPKPVASSLIKDHACTDLSLVEFIAC